MNSNQLFVYGKEYGRFGENVIKMHIDTAIVEKALSSMSYDEIEDWLECEDIQHLDWAIICMLEGMVKDYYLDGQRELIIKQWNKERSFNVELEEYSFGVGKTATEAKLKWIQLGDGDEDETW